MRRLGWTWLRRQNFLAIGTASDTESPTVPSNLTVSARTATTLTLTWDASTDNVGVVAYEVEYRLTSVGSYVLWATTALLTTTITGLTEVTGYDLRVRAIDAAGNQSGFATLTNELTADETAPTVPGNLAASAITATGLTLTWDASTDNVAVTEYEVQQRLDSGVNGDYVTIATIAAPTVTLAVTGLAGSTGYRFRVRAKDAATNASAWGPDDTGLLAATAYQPMSVPIGGAVSSIASLPDGGVIIGGNFSTMVAQADYTGTGYRVPAAGGTVSGLQTNGSISAVLSLPDGGVIIGGSFTRVQNTTRRFLARINADGSLHAWNPSTEGGNFVVALAISGTDVIVGGNFTTLGGSPRRFIGAVTLASPSTATAWNPSTAGGTQVSALAIAGTDVIVGGNFTTLGGSLRRFIGAVTLATPSTATAWNPSTAGGSIVTTLAISGTNVIVGGGFTTLGGSPRRFIGAVTLASPSTATAWNPSTAGGNFVYALALAGTDVIVGGNFTTLGGSPRRFIGAVTIASPSTATVWDPSTAGGFYVYALAISGADVIVGGDFTTLGGSLRRHIGAVPLATSTATAWDPSTAGGSRVVALAISGTNVIVGGDFLGTATTARRFLARINADGSLHAWNPSTAGGSIVNALALAGTDVIVGGDFTTLGGSPRRFIGAVTLASPSTATAWNPSTAGGYAVYALAISGTDVIVGGNFTTLGGSPRRFIGAVTIASPSTATVWDPSTAGGFYVYALAISGADVIVGGDFTTLGGSLRRHIGAVPLATSTATAWDPSTAGGEIVSALAISGTDVIVGGNFTTLGGSPRSNIGAVTLASPSTATAWDPSTAGGSVVFALAISGTDVIVGGDFMTLGGSLRFCIGAVTLATPSTATAWNPSTAGGSYVYALAISGTDVIVGGNFTNGTITAPMPNLPMVGVYRVRTTFP